MESLDFMLAQSFKLSGTITSLATDQLGIGRTVTWHSGNDTFYRIFLADYTNGTGVSTVSPMEFLHELSSACGVWTWSLNTDGTIRLTYVGTGTGALNIPAHIQAITGINVGLMTLASGAHYNGLSLPTHVIYSLNFGMDEGWKRVQPRIATKRMVTGQVYGVSDRLVGKVRKVSLQLHPKNPTTRAAWNAAHPTDPMIGSPMYPDKERMVGTGSYTGEPYQDALAGWSVCDMLEIAVDQSIGVAWGNLQTIIADDDVHDGNSFDVVFLTPECLLSGGNIMPSSPNWDARYDCHDIEFSLYQQDVFRETE
jgi:hypothetical protein